MTGRWRIAWRQVAQIRDALGLSFRYIEVFETEAEKMIQQTMNDAAFASIVEQLYGAPDSLGSRRSRAAAYERTRQMESLWGDAATQANIRGTAWAGYQVIAEYVDHYAPVRAKHEKATARADRFLGTGPVYLAEARRDGTQFNACITPGNSTTVNAPGYQLEVASNTGPGWSTHTESLAYAQGDLAAYLRADPDDVDESDDTSTAPPPTNDRGDQPMSTITTTRGRTPLAGAFDEIRGLNLGLLHPTSGPWPASTAPTSASPRPATTASPWSAGPATTSPIPPSPSTTSPPWSTTARSSPRPPPPGPSRSRSATPTAVPPLRSCRLRLRRHHLEPGARHHRRRQLRRHQRHPLRRPGQPTDRPPLLRRRRDPQPHRVGHASPPPARRPAVGRRMHARVRRWLPMVHPMEQSGWLSVPEGTRK